MNNGSSARYAIRVAGRLGATSLAAFPGLHGEAQGSETVLTGEVRDRSALYGIVALLDALGLELIELKRVSTAAVGTPPIAGPESGRPADVLETR
jgi:hypothetical protein